MSVAIAAQQDPARKSLDWTAIARWSVIFLAIIVRAGMLLILNEPVQSDAYSYFIMAKNLVEHGSLIDNFGQHAFYSPGYPLALSGLFAMAGADPEVARFGNLILGALSTYLTYTLAKRLSGKAVVGLAATIGFALWIPSVVGVEYLHKENLSIPLLLAYVLLLLRLGEGVRPFLTALLAGLVYGASLLVGASVILTVTAAAFTVILLWRRSGKSCALAAAVSFLIGVLAVIGPWMLHVDRTLGQPTLTTNGPFNLYLGNNPAATGRFVGIQDTPVGRDWNRLRAVHGEYRSAQILGTKAREYMLAHPTRTAELAARKLLYFWLPNVPDAADAAASPTIAGARWIDVAQHLAILLFAIIASAYYAREPGKRMQLAIVALTISSFWAVHAATYIIPRYRDPIMPLMIVLAAWAFVELCTRWKGHTSRAG